MQMEGAADADDKPDHTGGALNPPPPPPPPHKKRRTDAGAGAEKSRVSTTRGKVDTQVTVEIQPGESLKHFNR